MLDMPTQISRYEEMATLSSRMVEAARGKDWDSLVSLEKSVSALRKSLADEDNAGLSSADMERKAALIQQILVDDAEIRRHTEPWMEHLRKFLGDASKKKQVDRAYGGF
jgi:flagellar protein FliT